MLHPMPLHKVINQKQSTIAALGQGQTDWLFSTVTGTVVEVTVNLIVQLAAASGNTNDITFIDSGNSKVGASIGITNKAGEFNFGPIKVPETAVAVRVDTDNGSAIVSQIFFETVIFIVEV